MTLDDRAETADNPQVKVVPRPRSSRPDGPTGHAEAAVTAPDPDASGPAAASLRSAPPTPPTVPTGHAGSRVRILDGLRLLAALMVVSYHYFGFRTGRPREPFADVPILTPISAYGWLGVELFFLISGFVICMSSMGRSIGQFATSRIVRLFPAYVLAVALTTVVLRIWHVRQPQSLRDTLVNFTMLQHGLGVPDVDPVYWTLWAELRFYLLFAIVVVVGVTYRRVVAFCVIWLFASVFTYGTASRLPHIVFAAEWAPFFIAGIAMFLIHRFGPTILLWSIIGVCFVLCERRVLVLADAVDQRSPGHPVPGSVAGLVLAVFFGVMIAVSLGWIRASWKWLSAAGAMTYPLYLVHEYIGWTVLTRWADRSPLLVGLGTAVAMLGLSWLIHRFWERPVAARLKPAFAKAFAALER